MKNRLTAQKLLEKAEQKYQAGDMQEAKRLYLNLLKAEPKNTESLFSLGVIAYQEGEVEHAIELISSAIALNPFEPNYYLNLGSIWQNCKKLPEAIIAYQQALTLDPHNEVAANRLGLAFKKNKQLDEAETVFNALIILEPKCAEFYNNLGSVLYEKKQFDNAIVAFQQALKLAPNHLAALNNWAMILVEKSQLTEAEKLYQKIITHHPKFIYAYDNLAVALNKQGKVTEAVRICRKALTIDPNFYQTYYTLATIYYEQNNYTQAEEHFQRAIALRPKEPDAYLGLVNLFAAQDDTEKAIALCRQIIAQTPDYVMAYSALGYLLRNNKQWQEAIQVFKQAVALQPAKESYQILAALLHEQGQIEEAKIFYQHAADLGSSNARYQLNLLSGQAMPTLPLQDVSHLFDNYAQQFDHHLVHVLQYHTPTLIHQLVNKTLQRGTDLSFQHILDLGCGTGLVGVEFRDMTQRLTGVDLSSKMVDKAREKTVYDDLHVGDLMEFLNITTNRYDLIIAADVFGYLGDLDLVFKAVKRVMTDNSYFVFSVEHTDQENYILQSTGRYAHGAQYINSLVAQHQFIIKAHQVTQLRKEGYQWVIGDIYILTSSL